jgi:Glycosyl hydrolase family 10
MLAGSVPSKRNVGIVQAGRVQYSQIMGVMIFELPPQLAEADPLRQDLERSSVAGGQDNMPYPTEATVEAERLVLTRTVEESGMIQAPWRIEGVGQLMSSSATLMERPTPYHLPIELARGKINQVRSQSCDWVMGGLTMPESLSQHIRLATLAFGQALMQLPDGTALSQVESALREAYLAAHELVLAYIEQVFAIRHGRQAQLDTGLSCRLNSPDPEQASSQLFKEAFNAVTLPFDWRDIEPSPGHHDWEQTDRRVSWALNQGLKLIGGPLIDFDGSNLPDWLWSGQIDLNDFCRLVCDHVEKVVSRYHTHVRAWQITSGSNCAGVLARRDEELIWLTLRIAEAVRRVNPVLEVIVGLAQPWGDYLAEQERSKTPFIFADDLLRTGIKPSALDLEVVMGISPRGSYCRDLLETSRLLDLYALLGVPIQVTLGYPSAVSVSDQSCCEQRVNLGYWRSGYSEATQADWAAMFTSLAACKGFVRGVQWAHWSDEVPHQFPNCGLIDPHGRAKPALQELIRLRSQHLK